MIKSMTGFAAVTREDDRATIAVTIRALNHRYLDLQLRIPQSLAAIESDVRAIVAKRVARGRIELSLSVQVRHAPGIEGEFNQEFGRAVVAGFVELVAAAADEGRSAMEERLAERVRELRTVLQADETAVAQEIVRTASRSDISEEVSRFRGHVSHWTILTDGPEPCGRKLDFLLQEMNREVNTMGSKADGLRVSELVIAAKAELEKMREQVQNVE